MLKEGDYADHVDDGGKRLECKVVSTSSQLGGRATVRFTDTGAVVNVPVNSLTPRGPSNGRD